MVDLFFYRDPDEADKAAEEKEQFGEDAQYRAAPQALPSVPQYTDGAMGGEWGAPSAGGEWGAPQAGEWGDAAVATGTTTEWGAVGVQDPVPAAAWDGAVSTPTGWDATAAEAPQY
mmetsp:Transcript_16824/g.27829  ORF Transcript_16824/g.27829 Transcript_16824/m.27829 type:complete len:116 (+) Transcript_16824:405-752(+)